MLVFETRAVIGRHLTAISCSTHPKQPQWESGPVRKGVGRWIIFRVVATPVPTVNPIPSSAQLIPNSPSGAWGWDQQGLILALAWMPYTWGQKPFVIIGGTPWPCVKLPSFFILSKRHQLASPEALYVKMCHIHVSPTFKNVHSAPCHCVTAAATRSSIQLGFTKNSPNNSI